MSNFDIKSQLNKLKKSIIYQVYYNKASYFSALF